MTQEFNWSWINPVDTTKNKSNSVLQDNGTVYLFRQAYSGQVDSKELNAFVTSVGQRFQTLRSNWRTYVRPILNSLPAGDLDNRWSYDNNKGLPDKINCFKYGIQGSTLFVFNDADATKADGRYWKTDQLRPKTIAEKFEDLYSTISDLQDSLTTQSDVDLDPLWTAIGLQYRGTDKATTSGSLDARITLLNTYIEQLNNDIYDPTVYTQSLGTPLTYSIADMLDKLLKLHNVSGGWGDNPSTASHSGISIPSHTHAYTNISPAPGQSITQGRTGVFTTLDNDIKRLRYEIYDAKGSSAWNTSVTDPVTSSAGNLQTHINYSGSGSRSSSNPHALSYSDIGLSGFVSAVQTFTGMESITDSTPNYANTYYITQGDSLVTAIGKLDLAFNSAGFNVERVDYQYDRSTLSESEREANPITITHNKGKKPIVQFVDVSPGTVDYYGQYTAPDTYFDLLHINDDSFQIRSNAAIFEVIALY